VRVPEITPEDWKLAGLCDKGVKSFDIALQQTLDNVVSRGGRVKFNLDSLDVAKALAGDATAMGRFGRYTEWELQQIVRNKRWLGATDFFLDSKKLTESEILPLGIKFVK
jgi:hypothetical protein